MKKQYILLFLGLLWLPLACKTSKITKQSQENIFQKINQEVLANSKAYSTLGEASKTIGHRLTGSENGKKAEQYTYDLLKSYGLDVRFHEFEVEAWSRNTVSLEIAALNTSEFKALSTATLAHSPVQSDVTAEVIDVGSGLTEDFQAKSVEVKGKIALFYIGVWETDNVKYNLHRSEKTALAIQHGAIGVIAINQPAGRILLTGTASVTGKLNPIPAVSITKEDGVELRERLKTEKIKASIKMTNKSELIKARNVIGTIKGTEFPNEKIIIGGHLDSWDLSTGAIDNGVGSFAILDIARTFKALKLQTKRTIEFVMFMGEEQGLLGSRSLVESYIKNGTIEQLRYMINIDATGNPVGINSAGTPQAETFFKTIGQKITAIDSTYTNTFASRAGLHSDHQPFMLEGVPTLSPIGRLDPLVYRCYHADCDAFNLISEKHIRNTVRFVSMTLYDLANANTLPVKRMDSETTKQFLIENDLKTPLKIAGDWKWKD
ncbi:MAG: M20/M25/M40 family metallo-hydrolase [Thermoflexibacter sp.]|nr:M20/M25/M40 family metallo-hydrolase [Thermoflexibacter sp.]